MENNEIYNNIFNFLNQPFVIGIGVALIIGIFALIIVRELSIGKKSVKEQNKQIAKEQKDNADFKKYIEGAKLKLTEEKKKYLEEVSKIFTNFYKENEDFRDLTLNALSKINNISIKKSLEEYKNGKEAKDN